MSGGSEEGADVEAKAAEDDEAPIVSSSLVSSFKRRAWDASIWATDTWGMLAQIGWWEGNEGWQVRRRG
jgi:hypothetical protein